jgi:hypothetical protein
VRSKVHQNVGYTVVQELTVGMEVLEFAVVESLAWPVVLLTAASYIDNAWSVATSRAGACDGEEEEDDAAQL